MSQIFSMKSVFSQRKGFALVMTLGVLAGIPACEKKPAGGSQPQEKASRPVKPKPLGYSRGDLDDSAPKPVDMKSGNPLADLKRLAQKRQLSAADMGPFLIRLGALSVDDLKSLLEVDMPRLQRNIILDELAGKMAQASLSEAIDFLKNLPGKETATLAASAAERVGQIAVQTEGQSLNSTLAASSQLEDPALRSAFIKGVLIIAGTADPLGALQAGMEYQNQMTEADQRDGLEKMVASIKQEGKFAELMEQAASTDYRLLALPGVATEFRGWAEDDLAQARSFLQSVPQDGFTAPLYYGFASVWVDADPAGALEWLGQLPAGDAKDRAAVGAILLLRKVDLPQAEALLPMIGDAEWRSFAQGLIDRRSSAPGALPGSGGE